MPDFSSPTIPASNATTATSSVRPPRPPQPATTPPQDFTVTKQGDALVQTKQIGKYKVEVIRDKCIGAASCVAIAPKIFQLDETNIAIILSQDGETDEIKLLAAQSCPTAAIIVTNTETAYGTAS